MDQEWTNTYDVLLCGRQSSRRHWTEKDERVMEGSPGTN